MDRQSKRHPSIPVTHPGATLREVSFPALKRSTEQISQDLKVPLDELEAILAEKRPVTAELALKLSHYFGGTADIWVKMQAAHDLWKARQTVDVSDIPHDVQAAE